MEIDKTCEFISHYDCRGNNMRENLQRNLQNNKHRFLHYTSAKAGKETREENVLLVHKQDGTVKVLQSKFLRIADTRKAVPDSINNLLHLRILLFLCCLTSTTTTHNHT
jgi:hypothetical protein